eukprot:363820-Chlamydomonas_euryale.AAC.1
MSAPLRRPRAHAAQPPACLHRAGAGAAARGLAAAAANPIAAAEAPPARRTWPGPARPAPADVWA